MLLGPDLKLQKFLCGDGLACAPNASEKYREMKDI
jgi:hypothetical protein